jgi:hypothetical protein
VGVGAQKTPEGESGVEWGLVGASGGQAIVESAEEEAVEVVREGVDDGVGGSDCDPVEGLRAMAGGDGDEATGVEEVEVGPLSGGELADVRAQIPIDVRAEEEVGEDVHLSCGDETVDGEGVGVDCVVLLDGHCGVGYGVKVGGWD